MNTTIAFPPAEPTLKLVRPAAEKWTATLAEERRRLQDDHDALREREQNLRDYEARLRALQAEIDLGRGRPVKGSVGVGEKRTDETSALRPSSQPPFHEDVALQGAWDRLHRSREILEAEQRNLRDDRIAVRELEAQVKKREALVTAREHALAERAALIVEATGGEPIAGEHTMSAVTKFTRGPFNMARSVFRGKK